jgi:hypothetical protein
MTQEPLTENSALKQSLQPQVSDIERLGQGIKLVETKESSSKLDEKTYSCLRTLVYLSLGKM